MAEVLYMPQLSPTMKEGKIEKWLKKEGDPVEEGEVIAEVETDKALMDMEAFSSGVLLKILVPEGEKVEVGAPVAVVGEKEEEIHIEEILKKSPKEEKKEDPLREKPLLERKTTLQEERKETSIQEKPALKEKKPSSRIRISPLARRLAKEYQIPIDKISGTGPLGRIVKRDILAYLEKKEKEEYLPLSSLREEIAKVMLHAKKEIPHFYLFREVDVEELIQKKKKLQSSLEKIEKNPFKITLTDFLIRASALSLKKVPEVNVEFSFEKGIKKRQDISIGFAVAIEEGLLVPVIRDAEKKSLIEIARESKELIERARKRKLLPEEMGGESFTISNLGMFGIDSFFAIIHPPAVAILSVGKVRITPVYDEEKGVFIPRKTLVLGLSCDHRAIDGVIGAKFLDALSLYLENPYVL